MITLQEQFGMHLIVGLSNTKLNDCEKKVLSTFKPAGIILFKHNFLQRVSYNEWLNELKEFYKEVYTLIERDTLIVSIDHEGFDIVRAPIPLTRFPIPSLYKEKANSVAIATSEELKSIGVNLYYGPVADVNSNPLNPIIGHRAFGELVSEATNFSTQFYLGLKNSGLMGCAKHFPGHGDTLQDSHFELPIINKTVDEIRNLELIPFRSLIENGIEFIMTAHILFPKVEDCAATFSSKILRDILRLELNFKGIILSDDIDMRAVADDFYKDNGLLKSLKAGCDMFIISFNPPINPESYIDKINYLYNEYKKGIKDSLIQEKDLEMSRNRILQTLKSVPKYIPYQLNRKTLERNFQICMDLTFNS